MATNSSLNFILSFFKKITTVIIFILMLFVFCTAAPAVAFANINPELKEWTVIVYMSSKNDLEEQALADFNEMETVGSTDKVNVVVELGRMATYDASECDWRSVHRYLVTKDEEPHKLTSPVLQDIGNVDMGDYRTLADFIKWSKENYPAKRYLVIMLGHGSGWKSAKASLSLQAIGRDYETGHAMGPEELPLALKVAGPIDIFALESCYMQTAEVLYELRNSADYIVGSEEMQPGDGFNYKTLFTTLVNNPEMNAEQLGRLIVDDYADNHSDRFEGFTLSLIETSAIPDFVSLLNGFAAELMRSKDKENILESVSQAQSYLNGENRDLWDFAEILELKTSNIGIKTKITELKKYLSEKLIVHSRYVTDLYASSHGLAVYLPFSDFDSGYRQLSWSAASNWDEFILWYHSRVSSF